MSRHRVTARLAVPVIRARLGGCPVSDPELYEWLVLRRVADGGMAKSAGAYLDHGRLIPAYLTEVFDRLMWSGLLLVADGDPLWELRRISFTDAGQARYETLCQQRQHTKLEVRPPQFGTVWPSSASPDEGSAV